MISNFKHFSNVKPVLLLASILINSSINANAEMFNRGELPDLIFKAGFEEQLIWVMNANNQVSINIVKSNGDPVLVDVESVGSSNINNVDYVSVTASGIPSYSIILNQNEIDALNNRPKAGTDFSGGQTSATAGNAIEFGEDIGYNSNSNQGACLSTGGYGYWPPGPDCPEDTEKTGNFPINPQPNNETCDTGLGVIGYFVNGVSIFNWGDGQSYNNQRVWFNLAAKAETYDLDVCDGHAARGDYHHHFYSQCLANAIGDTANGHSPIYGFAADGYAIHGPWHAEGVLTKSAWVTRDYDNAADPYGCGGTGNRTCIMVDEFDPSMGTQNTGQIGPSTSATIISLSGNQFDAITGFYYQDYYYDVNLTNSGEQYLDENSGHEHGSYGYHYHLPTVMNQDGKLVPEFPTTIGPRFYGELPDDAVTSCGGMMPPPPRR